MLVEVAPPPAPPLPELSPLPMTFPLHAVAATALAAVRPSSRAMAVRGTPPSSRRSGEPQIGQRVSDDLTWQVQLGQAIKKGGMAR